LDYPSVGNFHFRLSNDSFIPNGGLAIRPRVAPD